MTTNQVNRYLCNLNLTGYKNKPVMKIFIYKKTNATGYNNQFVKIE